MRYARPALVIAALLVAATAGAAPITIGTWVPGVAASNTGDTPYSNPSWDCHECNLGFLALSYGYDLAQGEVLHAKFTFPAIVTDGSVAFAGITAFTHDTLSVLPSGGIRLTTDEGRTYDSDGDGWEQFILVRWISPFAVTTLLAFEDLRWADFPGLSDRDVNDGARVVTERVPLPGVPEPMSIALFGLGALGCAWRWRREGSRR